MGKKTIVCRPETNKIVKCIVGGPEYLNFPVPTNFSQFYL